MGPGGVTATPATTRETVTITCALATFPAKAVIAAVPLPTAVTSPSMLIEATLGLDVPQTIASVGSVAPLALRT
jgi:hypothetical protein